MRSIFLIIIGLTLGIGASSFYFKNSSPQLDVEVPVAVNTPVVADDIGNKDNEDIREKIDEINDIDQLSASEVEGTTDEIFGDCDPKAEVESINERLVCNKKRDKSSEYWSTFEEAEKEVIGLIKSKNSKELMKHTGCDAYDLTWYEMHCESDRTVIELVHYENLFKHIANLKLFSFINLKTSWVKQKPNHKKNKNPRWLLRSRLTLNGFKLNQPWVEQAHPTDDKVILLLEQKLNGRIYISGIPVTGVLDSE